MEREPHVVVVQLPAMPPYAAAETRVWTAYLTDQERWHLEDALASAEREGEVEAFLVERQKAPAGLDWIAKSLDELIAARGGAPSIQASIPSRQRRERP